MVWLEKQNFTAAVHGCGLKFMIRSGDKPVGQIAVLMMLDWCVPVCGTSFRQVERWVRRLVELAP